MLFWIKINDTFGYMGVDSPKDTILSSEQMSVFLDDEDISILEGNMSNYLPENIIDYLVSKGFTERDDLFDSNGDVHAYCFETKVDTVIEK